MADSIQYRARLVGAGTLQDEGAVNAAIHAYDEAYGEPKVVGRIEQGVGGGKGLWWCFRYAALRRVAPKHLMVAGIAYNQTSPALSGIGRGSAMWSGMRRFRGQGGAGQSKRKNEGQNGLRHS